MFEIFIDSPLFKGLTLNEINFLIDCTSHQIKHFSSAELIASSGEKVQKAMILIEGRLKGEMVDFTGNILKIEEIDPPQMVASAFLYGPQSFYPVNLSALKTGKMLIIYKQDFTKMLTAEQRVLNNYLNIISSKAQFLSRKITFLSFKTIKEKLAFFLLQLLKPSDNFVQINQTQKGIAELIGVARPSLARIIGEMEKEGLIIWGKDKVTISDITHLKAVIGK